MIQHLALALIIILVIIRAPRAASKPEARPAFWATVNGAISLSTWGVSTPLFTYDIYAYDALLGGSNVLTLVRDLSATAAFWYFREALARRAGGRGRVGSRWGLAILFGSYVIPFLLIQDRGQTSDHFVTDRLDQTAVWIYGSAYMATLVWLSVSSILNARRNWRGVQSIVIAGFAITAVGCLIEIGFLTASHFGYGGDAFRYSAWNAAQIPFFLGLIIVMLGIAWTAIVPPLRRRLVVARASRVAVRHNLIEQPPITTYMSDRRLIAHAQQVLVVIANAEVRGDVDFTGADRETIARARALIAPDQAFTPRVIGAPGSLGERVGAFWLTVPVAVVGALGAALVAVVGRRVIRPQRSRPTPIIAVPAPDRIVLGAAAITQQDGTLGLLYDDEARHAVLGPILRTGPGGIERSLTLDVDARPPAAGSLSRPVGNVFASAREFDAQASEVTVTTELGEAPAWLFPGEGDAAHTWAVHVHGSLSGRDAAFRTVHALRGTGYTSLVPSFRGDGEGPSAPLGAFTLGQTEWPDVDAAIALAIARGARRIVLVGWSSGASIALRLATSSSHRSSIAALILVSPTLSWRSSVLYSAANAGIPRVIAAAAVSALSAQVLSRLLGSPVPLDFRALDWTRPDVPLTVPTLLIHSEGDRTAPFQDTRTFSEIHEGATLAAVRPAAHALEWNADPDSFGATVRSWCASALQQ